MKTTDVINRLRNINIFDIFIIEFDKNKPCKGDIDIITQIGSTIYCIEIKEVGKNNKNKKISEGIEQLKNDRNYLILDKKHIVEKEKRLNEFKYIKSVLVVIVAGECFVYLFSNITITNKEAAIKKALIVPFNEFISKIGKYLSF